MADLEVTIKLVLKNVPDNSYFWEEDPMHYIFDKGEPWISGRVEDIKKID